MPFFVHHFVLDDHDVEDVVAVEVGDVGIDLLGHEEPERLNLSQARSKAVRILAHVDVPNGES